MKDSKWIKTEQMLLELRNHANCELQFAHWLGGILCSTHWLKFDSENNKYGNSFDWFQYDWYTESEFLSIYAGHWWKREH